MNTDTPTPRTDAAWNDPTTSMGTLARQLERELLAVTKERDEAKAELQKNHYRIGQGISWEAIWSELGCIPTVGKSGKEVAVEAIRKLRAELDEINRK